MSRFFLILIILQTFTYEFAYSQLFGLPHQERYTVSNGLSNNSITDIAQDRFGFLWIGTADGLNRYDGYRFNVYHPSPDDSSSISDSFISTLQSDQDGTLWIGTQKGGVNYYDFDYDIFKKVGIGDFSNRQTDFFVSHGQTIIVEETNTIWVGTGQGIAKIPISAHIAQFEFMISDLAVNCLYRDQNEKIWVGTSEGLYYLSPSRQSLIAAEGLSAGQTGAVMSLIEDRLGNMLVGGKNGLFVQEKREWKELKTIRGNAQSSFNNINALANDNNGRIWIAGQQGLEVIESGTYQVKKSELEVLRRNNLDKENIQSLFLDKEENLWIGTANNGLIRLFLSNEHFPVYRQNLNSLSGGTTENTIRSILSDRENDVWLGSYGAGLFRFNRDQFSFENYRANPVDPQAISGDQVSAIYRDSSNIVWIGTWGDGLNKMVEKANKISFEPQTVIQNPNSNLSKVSEIHRFFEDEYQNLWVIANGGLIKKNHNSDSFVDVTSHFDLPYLDINDVLEDNRGYWWIGTWNGLFVFEKDIVQNAKKDQPNTFRDPTKSFYSSNSSLSNNRITCLFQDSKDRIWVGTYGGGLNLWESEPNSPIASQDSFTSYTRENGLPNNTIYGILEDAAGRLWLSTNNGLVLFDPENKTFQVFTAEDGLQSNQFYFGAFASMPTGELIFGGNNGFNIINPLLFSQDSDTPPAPLITGFKIRGESAPIGQRKDGTTVLNQSILTSKSIRLQPNDNNFRFEFISPTFNNSTKLKYEYRLKGFNENWSKADFQNRDAVYSNLFEKSYIFEVRVSLDGKNWSYSKPINIKVLPPWYRTWWAYSLFTILFFLFLWTIARLSYIYSTLRNKLKLEKLSRQKEAEINEMRMWFFTYISHEFRTPLTLIISPLLEIINDNKQNRNLKTKLKTVYRNSQRLQRMVNQIMNFRLITSGKPEIKTLENDIVAFTKRVGESFKHHAQERNIDYEFYANQTTIPLWFDPEKMELIIYNLLSNAFKYSKDGQKVNLNISEKDDVVELVVKDRGIGIPSDKLEQIFEPFQRIGNNQAIGSGIGLALVKDLVELHKGTITVKSKEEKGSAFSVTFLKGKAHLRQDQFSSQKVQSEIIDEPILEKAENSAPKKVEKSSVFEHFKNKEKLQILIVEDSLELRKYLKSHFEKDFLIREAGNGQLGLESVQKNAPDLIISDVMMPVMDGLEMIRNLKANSKTSHIPIILLTAQTAPKSKLKGLKQGAFEYITKPIDLNLLEARVLAILKNFQQIKNHYKHEGILAINANHSASEEKFLLQAAKVIEENLANSSFNAEYFATQMGISRSGLYKKLQTLTGKSTTKFIRYIRLKYAEKLLKEGQNNISQTAFQVGFSDLKYFRKCFKEEFGVTPSEFMKNAVL